MGKNVTTAELPSVRKRTGKRIKSLKRFLSKERDMNLSRTRYTYRNLIRQPDSESTTAKKLRSKDTSPNEIETIPTKRVRSRFTSPYTGRDPDSTQQLVSIKRKEALPAFNLIPVSSTDSIGKADSQLRRLLQEFQS